MVEREDGIDRSKIVAAVLDKALGLLQDETFRRELLCFLSSVITQARPLNPPDKMTVMTLLARITSKQATQITEAPRSLHMLKSQENLQEIPQKLLALRHELTLLLHTEELFDSLNGLLADLLELSNTPELTVAHQLISHGTDLVEHNAKRFTRWMRARSDYCECR